MSKIFAKTKDGKYIVEILRTWGRRLKRKEMAASDIDAHLLTEWHKWWNAEANRESINNTRVEEHQREQVWKSFSIFSKRPLSSEEPEGWTDNITCFVEKSDPDSEDLLFLVVRFEERFPQMKTHVGVGWFQYVRGDVQVPSSNDGLW